MSIAEAALYGDLVKYLSDRWAEQAAEFNETAFGEERPQIDELIRTWFFTPQPDLHGLTSRAIIRNEELTIDLLLDLAFGIVYKLVYPLLCFFCCDHGLFSGRP